MTKKERMLAALKRQPTDRVPAGELCIEPAIANKLLGAEYPHDYFCFERDLAVRKLLDIDMMVLGDWPSWPVGVDAKGHEHFVNVYGCEYFVTNRSRHIFKAMFEDPEDAWEYSVPDSSKVSTALFQRFCENSDLFIVGQIGGPVSMLNESLDFEDFLVWSMTDTEPMTEAARRIMVYEVEKAKLFLDAGADAILIADDIAYNTGPFLPPAVMKQMVYPFYAQAVREIKAYKDVPVIMHTDGQLREALDDIAACGFDALQSLQPSAGMDITEIKAKYGHKLCLWGNLDLDYLMTCGTPAEVRAETRRLIDTIGGQGGFILSTCNTLIDAIPPENALAMYQECRVPR